MGQMNPKAMAGLKKYGKRTHTKDIEADLEGKGIDDPAALAVWVRKRAIGSKAFAQHQKAARGK